jgi:hypothetical protein
VYDISVACRVETRKFVHPLSVETFLSSAATFRSCELHVRHHKDGAFRVVIAGAGVGQKDVEFRRFLSRGWIMLSNRMCVVFAIAWLSGSKILLYGYFCSYMEHFCHGP